jgi:thiamine-phosphate pyrophosphorylase
MSMTEAETPPCRLYLAVPAGTEPKALAAALAAGDIACVLLAQPSDALRDAVHAKDIACFALGEPASGCDGVQIDGMASFASVRGRAGMVGVSVSSRHDGMDAAEAGADYVALSDPELIKWWAEIMETPCVAVADTLDQVSAHAAAGADFVLVEGLVWAHPGGPAAGVAAANAAIEAVARR